VGKRGDLYGAGGERSRAVPETVNVMASVKRSDMRLIDQVFGMESGYVLDFSNRTFSEFFENEFGINIYEEKIPGSRRVEGERAARFIDIEDGYLVEKVLHKLYDYRTRTIVVADAARALPAALEKQFFDPIGRIEAGDSPRVLSSLSVAAQVLNFDTVTRDLDPARASIMTDPEDALRRHARRWRAYAARS
jgi:hypothetical protein